MGKAKLTSLVNYNGEIITLEQLDNRGLLEYKEDEFYSSRTARGKVNKYCAYVRGTEDYYEITKALYLSKTGKDMSFKSEKLINNDGIEITENSLRAFNNNIDIRSCDYKERVQLGGIKANEFLFKVANYFKTDRHLSREDIKYYIENIG